jgi:murein L,D-transpeptidase YcbB/YkuD
MCCIEQSLTASSGAYEDVTAMTNSALPGLAAGLRRQASVLVIGLAIAASASNARAASDSESAVPASEAATHDLGVDDASPQTTGAIDAAPKPDEAQPAAATPVETPAPAPTPAGAAPAVPGTPPLDTLRAAGPVGVAMADLLAETGAGRLKAPTADRAALLAFYAAREGRPVWIENGRFTPKADAAKARIAAAGDDGLDAGRYRLPEQPTSTDDATAAARADVELSAAALAYAREAWGGRLVPGSVSPAISSRPDAFDAAAALNALGDATDVATALDAFNPQHPQFQALRKLLVEARASRADAVVHPTIPAGKLLTPGDDDPRVPALRKRFGLMGAENDYYYDSALADAVIDFQKAQKLGASGIVNRQTLKALNFSAKPKDDAALIEANMERWRWMPRDLGAKHVFVDLPAFELHIFQDGRSIYDTRVIIGKASNQTPLLASAINQIVVNPYWNVPVSIAIKELAQGSLRGFEVVDSRGRVVDSVDWEAVRAGKMRIRQAPGERNALGHIKFLFPNSHAVYLHDTSSRSLFAKSDRAMSHGCVRVDKPLEFADALSGDQGYSGDRLQKMIGGKERGLGLGTAVPVYLTYFTARVGDDGRLETRKDIYGLDERVSAALRGEPLPPIKVESLPQIVRAKPKPGPTDAQTASAAPTPQAPRRDGPGAWLARLFGDSRY